MELAVLDSRLLVHVVHLDGHGRRILETVLVGHHDLHRVARLGLEINRIVGLHRNLAGRRVHHERSRLVDDGVLERFDSVHIRRRHETDTRTGRHVLVNGKRRRVIRKVRRFVLVVERNLHGRRIRKCLVRHDDLHIVHRFRLVVEHRALRDRNLSAAIDIEQACGTRRRIGKRVVERPERRIQRIRIARLYKAHGRTGTGILIDSKLGILNIRLLVHVVHRDRHFRRILESALVRHDDLDNVQVLRLVVDGSIRLDRNRAVGGVHDKCPGRIHD